MKKREFQEIVKKSLPDLIKMRDKMKKDLAVEKAKSASVGSSVKIKDMRRDIARISTVISNKIIESAKV